MWGIHLAACAYSSRCVWNVCGYGYVCWESTGVAEGMFATQVGVGWMCVAACGVLGKLRIGLCC